MNNQQARQLIQDIYRDIWQGKDLAKFATYYHPQVAAHVDQQTVNYSEIEAHAHWQKAHFQNLTFNFIDILVDQHKLAFHLRSSGQQDTTQYYWQVFAIYHLKEDKIHRCWALTDPRINIRNQR